MNNLQSLKYVIAIFVLVFSIASTIPAFAGNGMIMCGDGMVQDGEDCDDGNLEDGDGCSANCTIETGATCDDSEPSICGFGCELTVVKTSIPAFNTPFDFRRVTIPLFGNIVDQTFTLIDSDSPDTTFSVPFLSLTFLAELEQPPGWQLDDISCGPVNIVGDGGFAPGEVPEELEGIGFGNIVLALCILDGEATCTFTNSAIEGERCNLGVTEVLASGSFETEFPFNLTAGDPENPPLDESFDLMRNESEMVPDLPLSSLYTLVQNTPEDFNLDSVQCEGDADFDFILLEEGGVQLTCNSPGNVNCTFVNSAIIVRNIPTMSEWGLIATAMVLGIAGILFYRRRMLKA